MTVLFVLLGLVVAAMLIGGILAFLPSQALGHIEKKIQSRSSRRSDDETS